MNWGRWPTRWAVKFNPKRGEYLLLKGMIFAGLAIWAITMSWLLVFDLVALLDDRPARYDLLLLGTMTATSWLCWWQFYRRVILPWAEPK